jgi:hypothetical protein
MTLDDVARWELELAPLVPVEGAAALARGNARSFNAEAAAVREAIVNPIRSLIEKGAGSAELESCLERTVAQLAFWRRVLLGVHPSAFAPAPACADCLLRYVLS